MGLSENMPLALIKQKKKPFVPRMSGNCPGFQFLNTKEFAQNTKEKGGNLVFSIFVQIFFLSGVF